MSNIINVEELKKAYEEASKVKEIKDIVSTQFKLIEKLQEENASLKERLSNGAPSLLGGKVSTEEMICIEQLEMLRSKSIGRELTLEEVKKLDLLNKNLRLAREQATSVIDTIEYQSMSAEELEQIASQE
jgi:hypothetical protein